jgi:DNA-binding MarR family transcriptional regulator
MTQDEKLVVAIVRFSESYQKDCSALFKKNGITFAQYGVLRALEGSHKGQNSITNVSKIMLVSGANMTGLSKRLEKAGFLKRERDWEDDRVTLLTITDSGRRILHDLEEQRDSIISSYLKDYPESSKKDFLALLRGTLHRIRT